MRTFIIMGSICLLAAALAACGPREPSAYRGDLYFGQGSYLMQFSLRDGSLIVVDNLGDKTIRDLSGLGPDKLLIAESASVNRKPVARIAWFDLKTGESAALYSGVLARYVDKAGIIAYDDGSALHAVPQFGVGSYEIIFPHGSSQLTTLLVVSGDTLLFEVNDAGQEAIHAWNALTGERRMLGTLSAACRLRGAVWIETLGQLACKERAPAWADAEYLLADLNGVVGGKLDLPADTQFLALTYISSQQALILQETWRGLFGGEEKSAVWALDVRTGERTRLARNQNLGTSVVYTEF
jgi:hypothetical protein